MRSETHVMDRKFEDKVVELKKEVAVASDAKTEALGSAVRS